MKLFVIVEMQRQCHGHGDYRKEMTLVMEGPYSETPMPAYTCRGTANDVMRERGLGSRGRVVEMDLIE